MSTARNKGIDISSGDLIAFVDADDCLDVEIYEILIKMMDDTCSDTSACTFVKEYDADRIGIIKYQESIPAPIVLEGNDIYISMTRQQKSIEGLLWNKVYRREVIEGHYFDPKIKICEDAVYSWEIFKNVRRVCYCDLPLYHYLVIQSSTTRNSSVEKYMTAIRGYKQMIADANKIAKSCVDDLSIQFLGWNITAFNQLVKQEVSDQYNYKEIRDNCINTRPYFKYMPIGHRFLLGCITKGFFYGKFASKLFVLCKKILRKKG